MSLNRKNALIGVVIAASVFFAALPLGVSAQPTTAQAPTTCSIEKMGWVICPVVETAAKASDYAYNFLASNFLEIQPELFNAESPTRGAWEQARAIANIAFVIAFLVLIYSQITGGLMSNYGIKKMLPRLIIAAILVNISYYICQGLVDISNILGYNLKAALDSASDGLPKVLGADQQNSAGPVGVPDLETSNGVAGTGMTAIAVAVMALGAFAWAAIGILTGSIGVVLGMILFMLIVLLLRKAFIVLLIVASPLAFVAYLLPNTERYFKQWLSTFWKLLLVFPIIALLMGAGQLASGIVLNSGVNNGSAGDPQDECVPETLTTKIQGKPCGTQLFETGAGQAPLSLGIAAAVIAIGPLIFAKKVVDESIAVGGKMFAEMSGKIEGASKATGKGVGAGIKSGIGKTQIGAGAQIGWEMRKQNKQRSHVERGVKGLNKHNVLGKLGKDQDRTLAAAAEHAHEMEQKDIKEQRALAQYKLDNDRHAGANGMSMTAFDHLEHEYDKEMGEGENANLAKLNALKTMLDGQGEDGQKAINKVMAKHMQKANQEKHVNHILQEHARHVTLHDTGMLQNNAAGYMTYFAASMGATTRKQAATGSLGLDPNHASFAGGAGDQAISAHTFAGYENTYTSSNVGDLGRQIGTRDYAANMTGSAGSGLSQAAGVADVLKRSAGNGQTMEDVARAAAETRAATRVDKI